MNDLLFDLEREESDERKELDRQAKNAAFVRSKIGHSVTRLQLAIVVYLTNHARFSKGDTRLPLEVTQRQLANLVGARKSSVHDALKGLQALGLATRAHKIVILEWPRVVEFEPRRHLPDPCPELVRPLDPRKERSKSHHPPIPDPDPAKSAAPGQASDTKFPQMRWWRDSKGLGLPLFWRDQNGRPQPDREGLLGIHLAAVERGWTDPQRDPLDAFKQTLGLALFLPSNERTTAGIHSPIAWFRRALQRGPDHMVTWPPASFFQRAEALIRSSPRIKAALIARTPCAAK